MVSKTKPKIFKESRVLKYFFLLVCVFFLMTEVWDIAVTLTVAHYNPEFFFAHEGNRGITDVINDTGSITIGGVCNFVLNYMFLLFAILCYYWYRRKRSYWSAMFFIAFTFILIFLSAGHLMGGYSWWAASMAVEEPFNIDDYSYVHMENNGNNVSMTLMKDGENFTYNKTNSFTGRSIGLAGVQP